MFLFFISQSKFGALFIFLWQVAVLTCRYHCCLNKCLQTEYDKLETQFETEKQRAIDLENSLRKAAEELSNLRKLSADWVEEKEQMMRQIDALNAEKKVSRLIIFSLACSTPVHLSVLSSNDLQRCRNANCIFNCVSSHLDTT
jgi:DNA-binding SARP family transcriptional activator